MRGRALIGLLVSLGAAMIAAGWILEDEGYVSDVFLQLGSTVLLLAPVVCVERLLSGQIG